MKWDISDGFWLVPLAERSTKWFTVRHPTMRVPNTPEYQPGGVRNKSGRLVPGKKHPDSGRLAKSTALMFGWSRSPEIFQAITSEIAGLMRDRHGVKMLVYIDDFIAESAPIWVGKLLLNVLLSNCLWYHTN